MNKMAAVANANGTEFCDDCEVSSSQSVLHAVKVSDKCVRQEYGHSLEHCPLADEMF